MTFTTANNKTYELRGGAWLDELNTCFYDVIGSLGYGYYLCRDITGKDFALYIPDYNKIVPRAD